MEGVLRDSLEREVERDVLLDLIIIDELGERCDELDACPSEALGLLLVELEEDVDERGGFDVETWVRDVAVEQEARAEVSDVRVVSVEENVRVLVSKGAKRGVERVDEADRLVGREVGQVNINDSIHDGVFLGVITDGGVVIDHKVLEKIKDQERNFLTESSETVVFVFWIADDRADLLEHVGDFLSADLGHEESNGGGEGDLGGADVLGVVLEGADAVDEQAQEEQDVGVGLLLPPSSHEFSAGTLEDVDQQRVQLSLVGCDRRLSPSRQLRPVLKQLFVGDDHHQRRRREQGVSFSFFFFFSFFLFFDLETNLADEGEESGSDTFSLVSFSVARIVSDFDNDVVEHFHSLFFFFFCQANVFGMKKRKEKKSRQTFLEALEELRIMVLIVSLMMTDERGWL